MKASHLPNGVANKRRTGKMVLNSEQQQNLFNYFSQEHNIMLMDSDYREIENIILVGDINAAPERLKDYIHEIEATCDPAGLVRENTILRDIVNGLEKELIEKQ